MSLVPVTVPGSVVAAESVLCRGRRRLLAPGLVDRVIVEFASADEWTPAECGSSLRLEVADGRAPGRRIAVPVRLAPRSRQIDTTSRDEGD